MERSSRVLKNVLVRVRKQDDCPWGLQSSRFNQLCAANLHDTTRNICEVMEIKSMPVVREHCVEHFFQG